jgi:hypothetical protein
VITAALFAAHLRIWQAFPTNWLQITNKSEPRITISNGLAKGFEVMREAFKYDPELMEKARWIVDRGLHRPSKSERQLELPLPMPREPEPMEI